VDGTPFTPDHKQSRGNIIIILVAVLVSMLLIYEVYRSGGDDHQTNTNTNIEDGTIAETTIQFETVVEQAPKDDQNQFSSVISSNGSNFNSLTEGAEIDQQKSDNIDKKLQIKTVPEVENKPVKKEGERALRFMFNEDSWVEVKDAKGKRVFSQTSPGNTEKTIYGRPPFSLTIGNAVNVKLVYNAEPVDLMPYTSKHGGVARLSLN
jgi:cytoskeleton protein RodZ